MTQVTEEEIKNEMLALFEEHESELISAAEQIKKIEDDAVMYFEMKEIALKNKIIADDTIKDEEMEVKFLEELELLRKQVLENTQTKLNELLKKQEETHTV